MLTKLSMINIGYGHILSISGFWDFCNKNNRWAYHAVII
mgnify:CR=1 FL=1